MRLKRTVIKKLRTKYDISRLDNKTLTTFVKPTNTKCKTLER